jgi:hypothetical protein
MKISRLFFLFLPMALGSTILPAMNKIPLTEQEQLNQKLDVAVEQGNLEEIETLVAQGAKIDNTMLRDSIWRAINLTTTADKYLPIIKFLLRHGANPNAGEVYFNSGTPIFYASVTVTDATLKSKKMVRLYYPQIVELLLQGGADPNIQVKAESFLDELVKNYRLGLSKYDKISRQNTKTFKLAVLFGGKANSQAYSKSFFELLAHAFPQRLLQAIAIGDEKLVREILAVTPTKVADNDGISALVYAAGQGNIPVLSVLLDHPAYSLDTTAIEQALEIVASRLKGLKPESPEYQQYKEIFEGLESHLSETLRKQIQALVDQAVEKNPALTGIDMPEEIQQQIFMEMLGNQDIFKRLFGPT